MYSCIFINGYPVFSNGPSNLPKNPLDCIIFDNWVFDNLISSDKWFGNALRRFETCLLVNNNFWGKLVSLSPTKLDDNLKITSFSFFIADLNLLSCEFDNFTFKLLYYVIFILIKIKLYFVFNEIIFKRISFIKLLQSLVKIQK